MKVVFRSPPAMASPQFPAAYPRKNVGLSYLMSIG